MVMVMLMLLMVMCISIISSNIFNLFILITASISTSVNQQAIDESPELLEMKIKHIVLLVVFSVDACVYYPST